MRRQPIAFGWWLASVTIVTLAWAQEPVPTEEQYAEIQTAFLREDFERVVALAQPILAGVSLEPNTALETAGRAGKTARVWLWCVVSLERLQRANDALRELDRLKVSLSHLPAATVTQAGIDRFWPEVLFWEGEISREAFKMVRARFAYQRLLTEFPRSSWRPHAQLGLGLVLFHQQAYEEARRQFHEVALLSSNASTTQEALVLEGVCWLQLKRFDEALGVFRQGLEQPLDLSAPARVASQSEAAGALAGRTRRAQGLFYLGEALTGLRRFEEAVQTYTQAIETDPDSRWAHVAYFGLGWSEFQRHRCRESLEAFHTYLSSRSEQVSGNSAQDLPDAPIELLFAQGRCLMELGDEAGAMARFEALRARDPEHTLAIDAALSMAELLQRQGQFAEAISVLDTVVRQAFEPVQLTQANLRLASLSLAQGDATGAIEQFQLATDAEDANLRQAAHNGLGDAHLFLGDYDEAAREYDASIRMGPTSSAGLYAAYQLGRLMLQTGKLDEAKTLFQQVLRGPDPARAVDATLALAFADLSSAQPDLARLELERVHSHDPTSAQAARASYYLALLALQEGKASEAKALCEDVLQRAPQSDEAFEARLLLVDLVANESSTQEALATLSQWVDSFPRLPVTSAGTVPASPAAVTAGLPSHQRGKLAKKFGDLARQSLAYAQAIHWYEAAWQDLPPQRGELEYRLASCYEEAGDIGIAMHRYQTITQAPWKIRGQLAVAKLMERAERWQEAMKIYEGIAQQPAPEAKIAEERLTLLGRARPLGERP